MPMRGRAAFSRRPMHTAPRICVSSYTRRSKCSFGGSRSSRRCCERLRRVVACTPSRRTPRTSLPSSTCSIGTAPSSPRSPRASGGPVSASSMRPASCFGTHWRVWGSARRRRCEASRGPENGWGSQTLLLFFDFLPWLFLFALASLAPSTSDWAPFAGLDLAPRVHPEDEEDDDANHAAVNRIGLPRRLSNVHGQGCAVLRGPPCVWLRRVIQVHLDRLVPLAEQRYREYQLDRLSRQNRVVGPFRVVATVEPLSLSRQEGRLTATDRREVGDHESRRQTARFVRHIDRDRHRVAFRGIAW